MLKAIIIDDEPHGVKTLEYIIKNLVSGVEVVGTANVIEDGERLIRKLNPDIVFLDIIMPRGYAFDLLERHPKRKFDVIVMSGVIEDHKRTLEKHNVTECLSKPLFPDDVKDALNRILKKHGL